MRRPSRHARKGTTVVEAAFVLPVFLFFLFGIFEFGNAQMVKNTLQAACREAARIGSTEGATNAQVTQRAREIIGAACNPDDVTIIIKNAGVFDEPGPFPEDGGDIAALPDIDLTEAEDRQLFVVQAYVNYNDIAIIPLPVRKMQGGSDYTSGLTLVGSAFMRHE